jgi:hypothetical protein
VVILLIFSVNRENFLVSLDRQLDFDRGSCFKDLPYQVICNSLIFLLLFFYSHVHTLFGSFLPPAPLFHLLPPSPLSSRQVLFCL